MIYAQLCQKLCRARNSSGKAAFPGFDEQLLAICRADVDENFLQLDKDIKALGDEVKALQERGALAPPLPPADLLALSRPPHLFFLKLIQCPCLCCVVRTGPSNHPDLLKKGDELYALNRKRQKLVGNSVFVAELYNHGVVCQLCFQLFHKRSLCACVLLFFFSCTLLSFSLSFLSTFASIWPVWYSMS